MYSSSSSTLHKFQGRYDRQRLWPTPTELTKVCPHSTKLAWQHSSLQLGFSKRTGVNLITKLMCRIKDKHKLAFLPSTWCSWFILSAKRKDLWWQTHRELPANTLNMLTHVVVHTDTKYYKCYKFSNCTSNDIGFKIILKWGSKGRQQRTRLFVYHAWSVSKSKITLDLVKIRISVHFLPNPVQGCWGSKPITSNIVYMWPIPTAATTNTICVVEFIILSECFE